MSAKLILSMAQLSSDQIRCFLCRRKNASTKVHKKIQTTICPVSKKTLNDVLQHLARSARTELHIPKTECVCYNCHCQLVEFDGIMVKLLRTQKSLTKLVENAAAGVDSDMEDECNAHMSTMDEFNDDDFFGDLDVSDSEIAQTVDDAMQDSKDSIKERRHPLQVDDLSPDHLHKHKQDKQQLQCQFCVMKFKNKTKLQRHISQAHKKFTCEMCDFSHRNEDYVMLHMNLHEDRPENQCRFCDKQFTTKISTIRHMEVHMNSKKYMCDKCGLCFSQTTVLYNHKLQHEAEEEPLRCEICNQIFKTKRTFRHHMITHQADRPRYSCEYCSKTFTEKYTLKVHKRTHAVSIDIPDQQQPAASNEVQEIPTTTTSAVVGQSPEGTKFNCIICSQTFSSKDHLNKHMEKEHDVILKSLTLSNFSQYDVVTHEPKKPCHICGHMFSAQTNLEFHLENVHGVPCK